MSVNARVLSQSPEARSCKGSTGVLRGCPHSLSALKPHPREPRVKGLGFLGV